MNEIELNISDYVTTYYENASKPRYSNNDDILAEQDDLECQDYRDEEF